MATKRSLQGVSLRRGSGVNVARVLYLWTGPVENRDSSGGELIVASGF